MDETMAVSIGPLREGFKGQRMFVVPRPIVRKSLTKPVTNRLMVTDAGFFPHASHHGRSRPKGSGQYIFMLCTDGCGTVTVEDAEYSVEKGDAVLLPASVPHQYVANEDDPWTIWWFHAIGPDATELFQAANKSSGGPVCHLRDSAPIASLVSQIIDALDTTTGGGILRASGAAWYTLTQVISTGRRQAGPSTNPVEKAVEHLRATTPRRTSVEELAAMVGLSPSQFGALFKQQLGVPPLRFQNDLRMARAREMLDSTTLSVAAISATCGYDDPLYFSRQFTKSHGESPTSYRSRTI